MFRDVLSGVWLRLPSSVRRWTMRLSNERFTVTSGAVIFNDKGEVLLLKHAFRPGSGWGIPGGFMKRGEQPEEALRRELHEEIGMEVTDLEIFAARSFKKPRQVEIVFVCRSNGDAQPKSVEVERASWFSVDALPEKLASDQRRLIKQSASKLNKYAVR